MTYYLYHGTTNPLYGKIRIAGRNGWGAYFAKDKKDTQIFGDLLHKVKIVSKNSRIFIDNEVGRYPFFNISKDHYDEYIKQGYDSLIWYRRGKLKEFVVLDPSIVKNYEMVR